MLQIGIFLALMLGFNNLWAQVRHDTVLIDFGSNISSFPWNNVTDPTAGFIADMINTDGQQSGIYMLVYDAFNNINTAGTMAPDPALGMPGTATSDSFFGNTITFGGQVQTTGGVELANLQLGKTYEITIFASRMSVADNRETRYLIEGAVMDSLFLDASNNTDRVVSISMLPDVNGVIRITASPGPNNNNSTGFYYLGAIRLVYEENEPPAGGQLDTLLIDFGTVFSPSPWNNVTDPTAGLVNNLVNTAGHPSGRGIAVFDAFTGVNTQGTTSPAPALGFPGSATSDSFYGNTGSFAGQVQPTGGVELFRLDPAKAYDIAIFASRLGTDVRETRYVLQGLTTDTLLLNASSNTDMTARTVLRPAADSTIRITASPGPNNNSPLGFFHLGAMQVLYEKEAPPVVSLTDTLLIDFGSNLSPLPWNNVTDPTTDRIDDLLTSTGLASGKSVAVYDAFNNINTAGTLSPEPAIGFPPTATGDSFFGNTATFGGQVQPTGGVEFGGLDPAKPHTFIIFASRMASNDNREARYILQGLSQETALLDAANNINRVATATLYPASNGTIRLEAAPGPNNNNTFGFYYLGALKLLYERSAVSPPELALVSPNGGEYWQVGKTPSIVWQSRNVGSLVLEYSTNNGATWTTIDTVQAFRREYPWTVPNAPSSESLVRLRTPQLSVQSARSFEIAADTTTCHIVVLGSSTAEGAGASPSDSAWVNRYRKAIFQKDTRYAVTNLARGGYTTYHILPTGSPIPPNVSISIDPQRNITRALSLQPYAVIINMPSNDAANFFPLADQLANMALIKTTTNAANAEMWVTTSQPRNFGNPAQILLLTQLRDSILSIYGDKAIDFWTGIAAPNGFIQSAFDSGDGIHLNNTGHRLLFERVLAKGIDTLGCDDVNTVVQEAIKPGQLLVRAFPNPFQRHFTLEFEATSAGQVELQLLDVLGRRIVCLHAPIVGGGLHQWSVELPETTPAVLIGIVRLQTEKGWTQGSIRLIRG